MYLALAIYACIPQLARSVFVQTGTTILNNVWDTCQNRQEFECVNNACDPVVHQDGIDDATCRFEDGGDRCLETIVAATGLHSMPDSSKNQGTSKHFYCLSVNTFDTPVIAYENSDCTGQSCFIPGPGSYAMWTLNAQANCIDIAPSFPIWTGPCLSPGETGPTPYKGGFVAGLSLPVGGAAGLPVSYNDTNTCNAPPPYVTNLPSTNIPNPPIASISDAYFPPYDNSADNGALDRRQAGGVSTVAALKQINYRSLYTSSVQPWIFIDENNLIAAYLGYATAGLSVDHIVEIETIVAYFTADWVGTLGLSQNQWDLISAFLNSQGNIWSNAGAVVGSCGAYADFRQLLSSIPNLRGVENSINLLKNIVFSSALSGLLPLNLPRVTPHWQRSWTRSTATATLEYLKLVQAGAAIFALSVGQFMDYIATPSNSAIGNDMAQHFQLFVESLWADGIGILQDALAQPTGFFKNEA